MYRTIVAVATTLSIAQIKIAAAIANLGKTDEKIYCIAGAIPLNSTGHRMGKTWAPHAKTWARARARAWAWVKQGTGTGMGTFRADT